MGVHIEDIPVLEGESAERFERLSENNLNKDKIDFSKEYKNSMAILSKSKKKK